MTRRFALLSVLLSFTALADIPPSPPSISFAWGKDGAAQGFFGTKEVLIGRSDKCDVKLEKSSVSREHARASFEKGKWWLKDLNSNNGTFKQDGGQKVRLKDKVELKNGDVYFFGDVQLTVSIAGR